MSGDRHDLKIVIPGQAEIIQRAVSKIMKNKVIDPCILARPFEGAFKVVKGLPIKQKHPVRMNGLLMSPEPGNRTALVCFGLPINPIYRSGIDRFYGQ